jgi:hypothetical protein
MSVLPGTIQRMAQRSGKVRVLSGSGWLAVNGRDTILNVGSSFELSKSRDVPLISALANVPLVLEISER